LKEALLKRYKKTDEGYRKLFYSARPEGGESQQQFIVRITSYLVKYIKFSGITQSFDSLLKLLVKEQSLATCSKELQIFLRERSIQKLDELAKHAEQFLTAHKYKGYYMNRDMRNERRIEHRDSKRDGKTEVVSPKKPVVNTDGKRRCWLCNRTRHVAKDCGQKDNRNSNKAMTM